MVLAFKAFAKMLLLGKINVAGKKRGRKKNEHDVF